MTQVDEELVERVAIALAQDDLNCSEFGMEPGSDEWFTSNARAALEASGLKDLQEQNERLRADCGKLADEEVVNHCEGCGAWLLPSDDYVADPDGVAGCWAAVTDLPSKRERPCYAYRVGKPDARTALEDH